MKVYKKNEDGSILMHSDVYLGEDYISPNLYHWKYLKKVKSPSGKWRYIYDDSEMKAEEKIHNDVKNKLNSGEGYSYTNKDGDYVKEYKDRTITIRGSYGSKQSAEDKLKEKRYNSYTKFMTKKIKDFPKRIISKGIGLFNKFLLNIEKSWIK